MRLMRKISENGFRAKTLAFPAALVATLLVSGAAFASEGTGTANQWVNLALRIINILIFVGIIWTFAGKAIKGALCGRREKLANELKELEERKAQAAAELAAMKERVAKVEADCEAVMEEYRIQAETQRAAIIEKANAAARQITEQAKRTAESEMRLIVADMRAELADLVTDAAEKKLLRTLDNTEQEKLIDKYLTKVVLN